MDDMPWISAYKPKEWTLHEIKLHSEEFIALFSALEEVYESELFVCAAESEAASNRWNERKSVEGMLFHDMEQILAMNLDRVYGVHDVSHLKKEWNGHPAGSLVMIIYKGADTEQPFFTVCVATGGSLCG